MGVKKQVYILSCRKMLAKLETKKTLGLRPFDLPSCIWPSHLTSDWRTVHWMFGSNSRWKEARLVGSVEQGRSKFRVGEMWRFTFYYHCIHLLGCL
jgi:hypothetical protein